MDKIHVEALDIIKKVTIGIQIDFHVYNESRIASLTITITNNCHSL